MCVSRLGLLLGLLLCMGALLSDAQHWSHGWYPGGKRELDSYTTSEVWTFFVCAISCLCRRLPLSHVKHFLLGSRDVLLVCLLISLAFHIALAVSQISEEIKLCEAGECSYLRPQRRGVLRNILVSELSIPDSMAEKINV